MDVINNSGRAVRSVEARAGGRGRANFSIFFVSLCKTLCCGRYNPYRADRRFAFLSLDGNPECSWWENLQIFTGMFFKMRRILLGFPAV